MLNNKIKLKKLLNLLSFKLDHKDYVAAFNLIYDLKLGNLNKEQTIKIFEEVALIEYEFKNYEKFSIIQGYKKDKD